MMLNGLNSQRDVQPRPSESFICRISVAPCNCIARSRPARHGARHAQAAHPNLAPRLPHVVAGKGTAHRQVRPIRRLSSLSANLPSFSASRRISSVDPHSRFTSPAWKRLGPRAARRHHSDRRACASSMAAAADAEIAAGKYRGPLARNSVGREGPPRRQGLSLTTWGAGGFEQQHFDDDAGGGQAARLQPALNTDRQARAWARLRMGGSMGVADHGIRTRNPWNLKQGSSGSSAGSASATSAGCVAFAIGTETLGSIASPSTALRRHRWPASQLRPRSTQPAPWR